MLKKIVLCIFIIQAACTCKGQQIIQNVRGKVISETGSPIIGAAVSISDSLITTIQTDSSGHFRFHGVPVGRLTLRVKQSGYIEALIPDLLVEAAKEVILEIRLTSNSQLLNEVVIHSSIQEAGRVHFTVEETKRFAATFYDPARLATSFPGVISDNDQANNIVIRGNSPNGLLWRVEGIDVLNPNHLDNAGTSSDRAVMNGGGVNILSAQLLDNSELVTGAYGAEYGNLLGGAFNIRLRKGNNERHEFTAQLGLLGTDIAAEGPLTKRKNSSYLINYRYSTIGLLSAMGVDFGGETTTFQDLSFNLSFPSDKAGNFTIFGFGGPSSTTFIAERDSSLWEYSRDRSDVKFRSSMGATGFTHTVNLNSRLMIKTSAGVSFKDLRRTSDFLNYDRSLSLFQLDESDQKKLSAHSCLIYFLDEKNSIIAGINSNHLFYEVLTMDRSQTRSLETHVSGTGNYQLVQPYVSWRSAISKALSFNAGLHYMHLSLNRSQSLEPRILINYDLLNSGDVSFAYDVISQVQPLHLYYVSLQRPDGSLIHPNIDLDLSKARQYSLAYRRELIKNTQLKIEAYYQKLFNIPVSLTNMTASALNYLEEPFSDSLANKGIGENYGIELSCRKQLADQYYFLFSSTVYRSTFKGLDNIVRDTRYNGNYAFSFSGGKEIRLKRSRILGINIRSVYRGGYLEMPIDEDLSAVSFETVRKDRQSFSYRLDDYFRMDLRISLKKERARFTRTLALDIQNVTNEKNIAYRYYDTIRNQVVTKYQLGIIPVLSYRVDFGMK